MDASIERKVVNEIDRMQDEIVDLLSSMVRIQTVNPPGEYEELALFVREKLAADGFETEIIEVPDEVLAAHNIPVPKFNVVGTYTGQADGPTLYLNAHLDTVAAEVVPGDLEKWTVPPFEGVVKDERVWGRGACDSKGRLTAYITAVLALKRAGFQPEGSIVVAATADEENSLSAFTGAGYLASSGQLKGDYAIVEGMSYEINYANPGTFHLRFTTYGDSLHTSQVQESGVNAIHTMAPVVTTLLDYREELKQQESSVPDMGHTVLNIGRLEGGLVANMTASTCTIDVAIIPIPEHNLEEIEATITQKLDALRAEHEDLRVEMEVLHAIPPAVSSNDSPLVDALQEAASEILGAELPVNGLTGRTDLLFFIQSGMQAVNFGPGRLFESNLHLPDENIRISDLLDTSKVIALAAMKLLGTDQISI